MNHVSRSSSISKSIFQTVVRETEAALEIHVTDHIGIHTGEFQLLAGPHAVLDLQHQSGLLAEKQPDDVALAERGKAQIHAAAVVGERHLEQRRHEAAGRHVVPGEHLPVDDEALYGAERRAK